MKYPNLIVLISAIFLAHTLFAQQDTTRVEEEIIEEEIIEEDVMEEESYDNYDFSNLVAAEDVKAFCSSRILNQGPQKLVSIGYDYQFGYDATFNSFYNVPEEENTINSTHGLRVDLMYPVISKNNILVTLNLNYLEARYNIEDVNENSHPLYRTLDNTGLRSTNFSAVVFKPLNMKNFLLIQGGVSVNGDYTFSDFQSMQYNRYFGAVIYGWKPHDRKMWGLGVTRTYLGGALNYLPVFYYQYSSDDGKWGIDAVLPSRFNYKRNFAKGSILSAGFNFDGNTYRLNQMSDEFSEENVDLELRRSELRFRLIYDHAITRLLWFSVQAGLRYNWQFNVDDGDFFRSLFSDDPYVFENTIGNPLYAQISLSWVSP